MKRFILVLVLLSINLGTYASEPLWPFQIPPQTISVCAEPDNVSESMLLASMSGVAAKAVDAEDYEEMVWVSSEKTSEVLKAVYRAVKPFTAIETDMWELLGKYASSGVVSGYVLYTAGDEKSVNAATAYASSLDAILVDESLVDRVKSYKLKRLKDCRNVETLEETVPDSDAAVVIASADDAGLRDFAIAYGLRVIGPSETVPEGVVAFGRKCDGNESLTDPFVFGSKFGNLPVLISAERCLAAKETGTDPESEDLEIPVAEMFKRIKNNEVR